MIHVGKIALHASGSLATCSSGRPNSWHSARCSVGCPFYNNIEIRFAFQQSWRSFGYAACRSKYPLYRSVLPSIVRVSSLKYVNTVRRSNINPCTAWIFRTHSALRRRSSPPPPPHPAHTALSRIDYRIEVGEITFESSARDVFKPTFVVTFPCGIRRIHNTKRICDIPAAGSDQEEISAET